MPIILSSQRIIDWLSNGWAIDVSAVCQGQYNNGEITDRPPPAGGVARPGGMKRDLLFANSKAHPDDEMCVDRDRFHHKGGKVADWGTKESTTHQQIKAIFWRID